MVITVESVVNAPFFGKAVYILFVLATTLILANVVNLLLKRSYAHSLELQKRFRKAEKVKHVIEKTKFNLFRRFVVSAVYIIGLLMVIAVFPELKQLSYSLLAGAGVLVIIIGFATQEIFANIVAGVFISMFEPFRIDDRVDIGTDRGHVEDITLWHTVIRTFDHHRLMIPNNIIAKEKVTNYSITDSKTLNMIDFGISYDSDVKLARKIITEEVLKNPRWRDYREEHQLLAKEDPFKVRMVSHDDFSIGLRLYVWTENSGQGFLLKTELLEAVKERFDKEGVEIPFPYRTIVEKKLQPKNKRLKMPEKRGVKKQTAKARVKQAPKRKEIVKKVAKRKATATPQDKTGTKKRKKADRKIKKASSRK